MEAEKWIFDNDGGIDDAYALVLALSKPDKITIPCITIVSGNVPVETAAKAVARTLEVCKMKIPIYLGATEGLVQPPNPIYWIHGNDGQGDSPEYSKLSGYLDCIDKGIHASQAIIRAINENPGDISILATGPLTNIALAIKLDPSICKKIKRFVIMGGTQYATGNASLMAEYNFHTDPEAAEICIRNMPFIEIVTVETGNNFELSKEDEEKWLNIGTSKGHFVNCISQLLLKTFKRIYCYDAIAAAIAIDPTVMEDAIKTKCQVELHGTVSRGALAIDWINKKSYASEEIIPTIIMKVNYKKMAQMLIESSQ